MARFYGGVQGQAGETTRIGSPYSGMRSFTNGWNCGVKVYASVDEDGNDRFEVYLTSGSGYSGKQKHIGTYTEADLA